MGRYRCIYFILAVCITTLSACAVSHSKTFWGLAYSPYRGDQMPGSGPQPTLEQIRSDMPTLAALTGRIRTYSVSGNQKFIPKIADEHGIRTWVGAWVDGDPEKDAEEIRALIEAARQPGVEVVVVGNEAIYRREDRRTNNKPGPRLSNEQLIAYIKQVKRSVSVPVAYADSWQIIKQCDEVVDAVDIALVTIYPYWMGMPVEDAGKYVLDCCNAVISRYPKKRIVIGEVGWPSAGPTRKNASADPRSQAAYLRSFLDISKQQPGVESFYFTAFDEYWKIEAGSTVGMHWGVLNSDASSKPDLVPVIGNLVPDKERLAASGTVMGDGKLMPGLDMGVNTSGGKTDWMSTERGFLRMAYPAGQQWGAVFTTVGPPTSDASMRGTRDYSHYKELVVELKGGSVGQSVQVGVKTPSDPDNGQEPKYTLTDISDAWREYRIPLSSLSSDSYEAERFRNLYVVAEFVFAGAEARDVSVRGIRFEAGVGSDTPQDGKAEDPGRPPSPGDVYVGKALATGYDLGIDTSNGRRDWVIDHHGYMECRYPEGQSWGAVSITVGKAVDGVAGRAVKDFSKYRYLTLDLKGAKGGESVAVGVKTNTDPDNGQEPKWVVRDLTTEWQTVKISLADLTDGSSYAANRLSRIYVACELVFEPWMSAETVFFRNIRFEP